MNGIIDKIWPNKLDDGTEYLVLSIGGEKYSVWDKKYMERLQEGSSVDYSWKQSGKFKKITDINVVEPAPEPEPRIMGKDRERLEIVRMSCIKSASSLVSEFDAHPLEKGSITLGLARKFEKYVLEDGENAEEEMLQGGRHMDEGDFRGKGR